MWEKLRRCIVVGAVVSLSGCSTTGPLTYVPSQDYKVGYFERQKDVYKWVVGTYYNLREHNPQQAANILMRRSAELAMEQGFTWMRILNYKTEMQSGTASMPSVVTIKDGTGIIYPGNTWTTNNDEWVSNYHMRRGASFARVEYFEFSRKVDCQHGKCGTIDLMLENCLSGGDGGVQETIAMCKNKTIAAAYGGDEQACMDKTRFLTKNVCASVLRAAYNINGFVEERNPGDVGTWYKTEEVLNKYKIRTQEWANIPRKG